MGDYDSPMSELCIVNYSPMTTKKLQNWGKFDILYLNKIRREGFYYEYKYSSRSKV